MLAATFPAMGTIARLVGVPRGPGAELQQVLADAARHVRLLERRWSRFSPDSELQQLNAAAGTAVAVGADTYALVERAVTAWRRTGGRFDPTVLAAVVAAGYDRSHEHVLGRDIGPRPTPRAATGCAGIILDPTRSTVTLPAGVGLDLGGIGKGFAADLVADGLAGPDRPLAGAAVDLGGDVRVHGRPPEGAGAWVVEVADPLDGSSTRLTLALGEGAVATSTSARRRWTAAGVPMHHIIDPITGRPADAGLLSVTVVAGSATWADVLAKAVFVAGAEHGVDLLAEAGATGLAITTTGEQVLFPGIEPFLVPLSERATV